MGVRAQKLRVPFQRYDSPALQREEQHGFFFFQSENKQAPCFSFYFAAFQKGAEVVDRDSGSTRPTLYPPPHTRDVPPPCSLRCMAMAGGSEAHWPLAAAKLFCFRADRVIGLTRLLVYPTPVPVKSQVKMLPPPWEISPHFTPVHGNGDSEVPWPLCVPNIG